MARILPPSVFKGEFHSDEFKPSQAQRLEEKWLAPEGVKAAVGITDVVGGTVTDAVMKYARRRSAEAAGKDLVKSGYDAALAKAAAASSYGLRQKAYAEAAKAWDRPGSGTLSKRWSGGPEETRTTQVKRMYPPLKPPRRGGGGKRRPFAVKEPTVQRLIASFTNTGTTYGRINAANSYIMDGDKPIDQRFFAPTQGTMADGTQRYRMKYDAKTEEAISLNPNESENKALLNDAWIRYKHMIKSLETPGQREKIKKVANWLRTARKPLASVSSHAYADPKRREEVEQAQEDLRVFIERQDRSLPALVIDPLVMGGAGGGGGGGSQIKQVKKPPIIIEEGQPGFIGAERPVVDAGPRPVPDAGVVAAPDVGVPAPSPDAGVAMSTTQPLSNKEASFEEALGGARLPPVPDAGVVVDEELVVPAPPVVRPIVAQGGSRDSTGQADAGVSRREQVNNYGNPLHDQGAAAETVRRQSEAARAASLAGPPRSQRDRPKPGNLRSQAASARGSIAQDAELGKKFRAQPKRVKKAWMKGKPKDIRGIDWGYAWAAVAPNGDKKKAAKWARSRRR